MAATAGNNCVKQLSNLRRDLSLLSSTSPNDPSASSIKGQINMSLHTLQSELDRMESLMKSETNATKREKHGSRLSDLRNQLGEVKEQIGAVDRAREAELTQSNRRELLGPRRPHTANTDAPENPYASTSSSHFSSAFNHTAPPREQEQLDRRAGNLKESSALDRMGSTLDSYIESGLASLSDLNAQSTSLKGTQKRLRDVAVGLGMSGDTIRMIERRTKGDKWVFYGGCLVTLVCFFLILRYFG